MVYGYIRVSTDKQTLENQRFEVASFCARNEMTVNEWIEETISGTKGADKRKLGELLGIMQKGDILICSELSRLGRNLLMIMSILNACMEKETMVWTIKDNYRLGGDINSKVLAFAFSLSAEIERNLISQRTKDAMARLKAAGVRLGRPVGSGKKRHKLTGEKTLIRKLLRQKISMREIAKRFNVSRSTLKRFLMQ